MTRKRVVVSWSSGKDSAWCAHVLSERDDIEVTGVLTTFNQAADRVAMHAVRRELATRQADALGVPLHSIELPWPCSNDDYERVMRTSLDSITAAVEFEAVAFGDLFLEDIRRYREERMASWGYEPLFPLWGLDTHDLAATMVDGGLKAILTCVDPKQCPAGFAGRHFDRSLLEDLPETVDPCGENGEFHTFVFDGPMFSTPIDIVPGDTVERDGFFFTDLLPKRADDS